jgi:hypothetical protein
MRALVFGHAIEGLGRLGRQAMVLLTWVLILIALALATLAALNSGRAQELGIAALTGADRLAVGRLPAAALAQPAFSTQNVSGR